MSDSPETIVQIVREILHVYFTSPRPQHPQVVLEDIDMVVNQKKIEVVFDD
jgi:hypothetical protein